MTELLDTIDASLQEVEEQLLEEFDRIRNTISDARFESIDTGIKNALSSVVGELHQSLEQTGDVENLQLMTQRHEVLYARVTVLRQLLNARVPTAFLHEAHKEVVNNRRVLEHKVRAQRNSSQQQAKADDQKASSSGVLNKIKGMFGSDKSDERAQARNRIQVTKEEQQALEPMNIYLDNGIYSASRELAALANVFSLPPAVKEELQEVHEEKMRAEITGKATFASRDLASRSSEVLGEKISGEKTPAEKKVLAQSPEEIRKKLAERDGTDTGKASFSSKDIHHVAAVDRGERMLEPELTATEIATKRKAELEAEKAKQPTTGKASFLSKDIEPIVPQEAPRMRPKPKDEMPEKLEETPRTGRASFTSVDIEPAVPQEPPRMRPTAKVEETELDAAIEEAPRTGKAVFESRDLSKTPPESKR